MTMNPERIALGLLLASIVVGVACSGEGPVVSEPEPGGVGGTAVVRGSTGYGGGPTGSTSSGISGPTTSTAVSTTATVGSTTGAGLTTSATTVAASTGTL
jgi:hypothetical protein